MKKIILSALIVSTLSGCAGVSQLTQFAPLINAGISSAAGSFQNMGGSNTSAAGVPSEVQAYQAFAQSEGRALGRSIQAMKLAGFRTQGSMANVSLVQRQSTGMRTWKIDFAESATFPIPKDALETRNVAVAAMGKAVGQYAISRKDPSRLTVVARSQAEVDYLKAALLSGAPGMAISGAVKNEDPSIGFVSLGNSVRTIAIR